MSREAFDEKRIRDAERDLDRKITFAQHMHAQVVALDIKGGDTNVDKLLDATRIKSPPLGVQCVEARNLDNYDDPGSLTGSVRWTYRTTRPGEAYVRIHSFPGLTSGTRYRVTLLVLGS